MYNSNNVADRIKTLAKNKKKIVKDILTEAGLSKNSLANFKTSMPKADNLAKIADSLNCSVDYLLGRTDNPTLININVLPRDKIFFIDSKTESLMDNITKKSSEKVINFVNSGTVEYITIGENLEPIYTICTNENIYIDIRQSSLAKIYDLC